MSERVKVYLQPFCGSSPCPDDDDPKSGALVVHRITIDGGEVPFTKALINMDARGLLTVNVELVPGHLEVITRVDPYEEENAP